MRTWLKTRSLPAAIVLAAALGIAGGIVAQTTAPRDAAKIGPRVGPALRAQLAKKKTITRITSRTNATSTAPVVHRSASTTRPTAETEVVPSGRFSPVLPPKDYAPPALFIADKRHDFGSVFQGEDVVHSFRIENRGGSDLQIQRIKPSCGCTYVDHDKVIKPGGSGQVTLKIDTKRLRAGTQNKTADIFSNDPTTPKEKVYIQGKVETVFNVEPSYPRIEAIRGTANPSTVITLTRTVDQPFKVTGVSKAQTTTTTARKTNDPSRLVTSLEETDTPGVYNLTVTAPTKEGERSLNFYEKLTIDIEDESGKKLSQDVSVTVRFKDRISHSPRTVWFRRNEVQAYRARLEGASAGGQQQPVAAAEKSVTFKSEVEDFQFNITKVESSDPHFSAAFETIRPGNEYKVKVSLEKLPEDRTIRSLKGDIVVHTDDPANPEIKFRVIAYL